MHPQLVINPHEGIPLTFLCMTLLAEPLNDPLDVQAEEH